MPLENHMATPQHFVGLCGVLNQGMSGVTLVYMVIGFFGYLKYGDQVEGSITLNLPKEAFAAQIVNILIALAVYGTFGLQFYVCLEIAWDGMKKRFEENARIAEYSLRTIMAVKVDHFSRHLLNQHNDEDAVKKIPQMPLKSNERRVAVMSIRKKGNFILHEQKNIIKAVRFPNKNQIIDIQEAPEYFPCDFIKKSYLWRHNKICKSKVNPKALWSRNHLTDSQTFLATTGMLGNVLNKSRVKKEVFSIMRPDHISYMAKADSLIYLFGESYINKHKRKQMNVVVSNKMRQLARLKIALVKSMTAENLIDVLKPECYEIIVAATKLICGFDPNNKTFRASSLALQMGTTLKFLCDAATKAILTKNPLFSNVDREQKVKDIKMLRYMISTHWCNDVSSLANKVLNEQKLSEPKLLAVTEDIKTLNTYVKTLADQACDTLKKNQDMKMNYKVLTEYALVLAVIFNRKRIGEVQILTMAAYENCDISINQECLKSLTEIEKCLSATFKRVVVFGKGSKPVPILFTKLMQKYVEMILAVRKTTTLVPQSNTYIFANPNSNDRWMSGPAVLRKYAHKCGAKNPELLTSTKFRKQLATILQLMNFESDKMEQIARFMGHTEKTHKEFYRLTENVYQTAKVAKVLLLSNNGKGSELKGKSLAEIEVGDDLIGEENAMLDITKETQKGYNRKRWEAGEKQLVLKHFNKHVQNKIAPKKQECIDFINKNPYRFSPVDWILPTIIPFVALIGAFCFSILGLMVPVAIEMLTFWDKGFGPFHWKILKNVIVVAAGLLALIFGSKSAIQDIVYMYVGNSTISKEQIVLGNMTLLGISFMFEFYSDYFIPADLIIVF
nr:unnamed protein product [Callosobruchus analis]